MTIKEDLYPKSGVFWFQLNQAILHKAAGAQDKYTSNIARQRKQGQYDKRHLI